MGRPEPRASHRDLSEALSHADPDRNTVVIVAIPADDDYVWKMSSEKVPHLTLIYLGDQVPGTKLVRMAEFIEHAAASSLGRFGMSVDHRGELGDDKADVLFFEKNRAKPLEQFRSHLLANSDIREAYDAVEQYPEWTPHLTLGYPETPANPDDREYPGVTWVRFDRIALWIGDSEGPEFLLKDQEMSMSSSLDDVLAHFGIKGMKWGVRRSRAELDAGVPTDVVVKSRPGKGVQTSGGRGQPPSDDAIKAAVALQKARASSPAALSNNELADLNKRLQLEQQYVKLVPTGKVKKGQHFTKEVLNVGATVNDVMAFANSPAGKGIKDLLSSGAGKHVKR